MSTVTPFLNLVKPAPLEPFSLSTYKNNLDLIDAGVVTLNKQAKGYQAYSELNPSSGGINTLTVVLNIATFTFKANRRYRVGASGNGTVDALGSTFVFAVHTTPVGNTFADITGLTQLKSRAYRFDATGESRPILDGLVKENLTFAADTTLQIKLTVQRAVGTSGSVTVTSTADNRACLFIEDLGEQF